MIVDQKLMSAAKALLDSVKFDDSGVNGRGGNGGLISQATIRKADELRMVILSIEKSPTPATPTQE